MKPLSLNFTWQPDRRPTYLGYGLLIVAILVDCGLAWLAYDAQVASVSLNQQRQALHEVPQPTVRPATPEENERLRAELVMAQTVIERLDTPWGALFAAVESAFDEQATLLNVEPDPEHREVRLSAEAKDLAAMQAYIRQLRQVAGLRDAYLASHQVNQQDPLRPVRFVANARWVIPPKAPAEKTGDGEASLAATDNTPAPDTASKTPEKPATAPGAPSVTDSPSKEAR